MSALAVALVLLVAALHVAFGVLEMFLWQRPAVRRAFGTDAEFAARSAVLAANQGLYNGFLAAGLVWSTLAGDQGRAIAIFFLACVIVAGMYGAATVSPRIALVQALPAALALVAVLAS